MEHDTLLVLCESRGETTGDGEAIEERELPSKLWTLAVSVLKSYSGYLDSELQLVRWQTAELNAKTLLLSPWKGAGEQVELCSEMESLGEPYDEDGNILSLSIALRLKW